MKIRNLLFGILALVSSGVMAQFSLSGEFRPRTEWFGHGQSKTALKGTEGYVSTSVRAALKAKYTAENLYGIHKFSRSF